MNPTLRPTDRGGSAGVGEPSEGEHAWGTLPFAGAWNAASRGITCRLNPHDIDPFRAPEAIQGQCSCAATSDKGLSFP